MYFKHNGISSTKMLERVCWGVQVAMILTLVSKRKMPEFKWLKDGYCDKLFGSVIDGGFLIVWTSVRLRRTTVLHMFR